MIKYRPRLLSSYWMSLLLIVLVCSPVIHLRQVRGDDAEIEKKAAANIDTNGGPLALDHAYVNKSSGYEDDTIHVFIKNRGNSAIELSKLIVNDKELPFYNSRAELVTSSAGISLPNDSYIWTQVYPNPIPANGVSDIMIKPTQQPRYAIKASLEFDNGQTIKTLIHPQIMKAKLKYVGFSTDFKQVYLYIYNADDKPLQITSLLIDDKEMKGNSRFLPEKLRPKTLGCVVVSLERALRKGQYVAAKIISNGPTLEAVVRAFSFFPISSWGGDTRPELYLDPEPLLTEYQHVCEPAGPSGTDATEVAYVFNDPVCNDNKGEKVVGSNAMEVIRRGIEVARKHPSTPTFTHICEYDKKHAYRIYAKTVDIAAINPYEVELRQGSPKGNEYYTIFGKISTEPRMLITVPEAYNGGIRYTTPEEARLTTYYEIARGSKGIVYYTDAGSEGYRKSPELEYEIARINKELRVLKDFLKIGEPCALATSNHEQVDAHTILVADLGIVLIAINNDYKNNFDTQKHEYFTYTPKTNIDITIDVPDYLNISKAYSIGDTIENIEFQKQDNQLSIKIDQLELTEQIILVTESEQTSQIISDAQWDWDF